MKNPEERVRAEFRQAVCQLDYERSGADGLTRAAFAARNVNRDAIRCFCPAELESERGAGATHCFQVSEAAPRLHLIECEKALSAVLPRRNADNSVAERKAS